ncbi:hypothetical protein DFJ74DRAFT_733063 [Hyaloraphidium curvatum]|nr:hypothetical protein DFJ74DRAFT_733063 [Hyaloraphidium curvatum]
MSAYGAVFAPSPDPDRDDRIALRAGPAQLTYRGLRVASQRFARSLRDVLANWWPFRKGDVVGIVVPSAHLEGNPGDAWRLTEMAVALMGVLRAGGTACILPYRPDLRNQLAGLHGDAVTRGMRTTAEPGEPPSPPRVLVTPNDLKLPFPVLCYGSVPTETVHRDALMTRSVGDMVARGGELNDDVLPNWDENEDGGRWAVWWEELGGGRDYPSGRGWTHRELRQLLARAAESAPSDPLETDPRTLGAPTAVLTALLEPFAAGRTVVLEAKRDFTRIKLKL